IVLRSLYSLIVSQQSSTFRVSQMAEMVAQLLPIWAWPKLPEYNCSRVRPVGDEWTTLAGEPQPLFGYWSMTWGVILYVPCTMALYMERRQACYRV
ncbi:hypothetical protein PFISCL1PPCAC_13746, partial [Pristionchus fissidentatus]